MEGCFGRAIKSAVSSFFSTLFLVLVCGGFLALLTIPDIAVQFAPFVCPEGEMTHESYQTFTVDGTSTVTDYYCTPAPGAEPVPITFSDFLPYVLSIYGGFFLLIVWPILFLTMFITRGRRGPDKTVFGIPTPSYAAPPVTNVTTSSSFVVDGQTYTSVDQLPPAARLKYDQAMSRLPDADGDGVPDILQGQAWDSPFAASGQTGNAEQRLEKLQQMRDKGLITSDEYERKRAEIIDSL